MLPASACKRMETKGMDFSLGIGGKGRSATDSSGTCPSMGENSMGDLTTKGKTWRCQHQILKKLSFSRPNRIFKGIVKRSNKFSFLYERFGYRNKF